ncbi:hypothetical protein KUL106_03780 [Alteromonas sp. KUL106]|nr:hypothetical protein KUL106_03780 [Alteromonas sp. KUL106]
MALTATILNPVTIEMPENEKFWSEVSCTERLSLLGPSQDYRDVVPFARNVVESYP